MNFKCLFGFHAWNGCKCAKCARMRDQEHDWHARNHKWQGWCERCANCGKERNAHIWKGCKCMKCSEPRDEGHDWNGCSCIVCLRSRDEQHNWVGCQCARCGRSRDEEHNWQGLKCPVCGMERTKGGVTAKQAEAWARECGIKQWKISNGILEICLSTVKVRGTPLQSSVDHWNARKACINSARAILTRLSSLNEVSLKIAVPWQGYEPAGSYYVADPYSDHFGWNDYKAVESSSILEFHPLHLAAEVGDKHTVEFLLARGADVNAYDSDGNPPLYYVARWGRKDTAEVLLAHGADVNAKDRRCQDTPLHWVVFDQKHTHDTTRSEVAELLRQHGGHE